MNLFQEIKRRWSIAPNRASAEMPDLYGKSPRLDPVRYIAKTCAGEELKLYKKSEYRKNGDNAEPLGEHELYDLLDRPCPTFPELDGFTLRYLTFAYIDLVGECGWLKVRDGKRIIALLPIPKAWIISKPTVGNHIYKITPYGTTAGEILNVLPEDFVYFKDVDLNDPYGNGKGLSESVADELETDEYASKYQKNFFYNDATPPYVVTGYQGNEQGADRLKKSLLEKIGGFRKAREPAILTGAMDIKTVGISPKELDMVESRKFLRDECLQHYQLPPEIFGIIENSNRATIDASYYLTQKNVIIPRLKFFERVLNTQLLYEFDDLMCRHNVKVIEDEDLKLRIYETGLRLGAVTKEQFCEQFGINPSPDEGHYIVPIGVSIIPANEEFSLADIPSPTTETEPEEEVVIEDENGKSFAGRIIKQDAERKLWKEKLWHNFDTKARENEPAFINAVKKIARKQKGDISEKIKALKECNDATINNLVNDYFQKECDEAVKHGLAKCWLDSMSAGRENAKFALENKKDISVLGIMTITNDQFNKWVDRFGLAKSTEINQTTKKQLLEALRSSLTESIENGDSMKNTKDKLQESAEDVFEELSDARAMMIARTETGTSVNYGQTETYRASGIEQKEWIATLDDRTRESHLLMDGKIVSIDETFEVENLSEGGVDNMMYPLDPNGSAGNVCNCRCSILPVIL